MRSTRRSLFTSARKNSRQSTAAQVVYSVGALNEVPLESAPHHCPPSRARMSALPSALRSAAFTSCQSTFAQPPQDAKVNVAPVLVPTLQAPSSNVKTSTLPSPVKSAWPKASNAELGPPAQSAVVKLT